MLSSPSEFLFWRGVVTTNFTCFSSSTQLFFPSRKNSRRQKHVEVFVVHLSKLFPSHFGQNVGERNSLTISFVNPNWRITTYLQSCFHVGCFFRPVFGNSSSPHQPHKGGKKKRPKCMASVSNLMNTTFSSIVFIFSGVTRKGKKTSLF